MIIFFGNIYLTGMGIDRDPAGCRLDGTMPLAVLLKLEHMGRGVSGDETMAEIE
jgi:hypothetical protein